MVNLNEVLRAKDSEINRLRDDIRRYQKILKDYGFTTDKLREQDERLLKELQYQTRCKQRPQLKYINPHLRILD
jgi:ribosomal protein L44E